MNAYKLLLLPVIALALMGGGCPDKKNGPGTLLRKLQEYNKTSDDDNDKSMKLRQEINILVGSNGGGEAVGKMLCEQRKNNPALVASTLSELEMAQKNHSVRSGDGGTGNYDPAVSRLLGSKSIADRIISNSIPPEQLNKWKKIPSWELTDNNGRSFSQVFILATADIYGPSPLKSLRTNVTDPWKALGKTVANDLTPDQVTALKVAFAKYAGDMVKDRIEFKNNILTIKQTLTECQKSAASGEKKGAFFQGLGEFNQVNWTMDQPAEGGTEHNSQLLNLLNEAGGSAKVGQDVCTSLKNGGDQAMEAQMKLMDINAAILSIRDQQASYKDHLPSVYLTQKTEDQLYASLPALTEKQKGALGKGAIPTRQIRFKTAAYKLAHYGEVNLEAAGKLLNAPSEYPGSPLTLAEAGVTRGMLMMAARKIKEIRAAYEASQAALETALMELKNTIDNCDTSTGTANKPASDPNNPAGTTAPPGKQNPKLFIPRSLRASALTLAAAQSGPDPREVFARKADLAPQAESLRQVADFVHQRLALHAATEALTLRSAEEILASRRLDHCGDYAVVAAELVRLHGYEARLVLTASAPWIVEQRATTDTAPTGHLFVEVYMDGAWRLLDPVHRSVTWNPEHRTGDRIGQYLVICRGATYAELGAASMSELVELLKQKAVQPTDAEALERAVLDGPVQQ